MDAYMLDLEELELLVKILDDPEVARVAGRHYGADLLTAHLDETLQIIREDYVDQQLNTIIEGIDTEALTLLIRGLDTYGKDFLKDFENKLKQASDNRRYNDAKNGDMV